MELLRFTASWCQPCKALATQLEEIGISNHVTVVDIDEKASLAQQYGIRSVPTLLLLQDGKEVKRLVGNKARNLLLDWLPDIDALTTKNENIIKSNN